ncbi:MAG: carbon starvation protein A [Deltaproteobacteria bacterium]|nr:carbon starvation protein A [Deltaproteobacteria bacterium]
MNSLFLTIIIFAGFIVAYNTYGRFLGKRIFKLATENVCPSHRLQDDIDFVPTNRHVLFGHHFTSIAGLGPIVGPAVGMIWGWVPAMLWVFFGSIFIGAVHDFGALIVSLRHDGRSIGDISADLINHRVRTLFLLIIFFLLLIVIAVFALVIAILFTMYPQSVIPIWVEIPIAVWLGYRVYHKNGHLLGLSIVAVVIMYAFVVVGAYYPIDLRSLGLSKSGVLVVWMVILYIYAYIASILPVQTLLQPRDFINSHQLLIALGILCLGVLFARPEIVAPAYVPHPPGAPSMLPFIFVVIACGALSGFHSLVSSGTSSKQCYSENDARFVGYGSMLMEGALAALVIVSCAGGLGMGLKSNGEFYTGAAAFSHYYSSWAAVSGLGAKINAFVYGASNMVAEFGIPHNITITIMGVFIVSFAGTTLDTATRLQRYIVGEIATAYHMPILAKRHPATLIAVLTAFGLAFFNGSGKGALMLWPLFGTVNQLLGTMALLVITIYLIRRKIPAFYTAIPLLFMVIMTGWAMSVNLVDYFEKQNILLFVIGGIVFILELWMIVEAGVFLKNHATRSMP